MDPTLLAAIGKGVQMGANYIQQGTKNKKDRVFAEKMYEKEKFDRRQDWDAQNAYNSPKSQMKRYEEAGMNPNLVHQGAPVSADAIRGADYSDSNQEAPKIEGLDHLVEDALTVRQTQANINNTQIEARLLEQQIRESESREMVNLKSAVGKGINNDLALDTYQTTVAIANQRLANMQAQESNTLQDTAKKQMETKYLFDKNDRDAISQKLENAKTDAETLLLAQNLINAKATELEIKMRTAKTEQEKTKLQEQIKVLKWELEHMASQEARAWIKAILD